MPETMPSKTGNLHVRAAIFDLQKAFESIEYDEDQQALCPLTHFLADGIYARQMFIPAGMCIVGAIHKFAHINTISQGIIRVVSEFGSDELVAPITFVSQAGTKRAVFAVTDTIWTTYHATEETDISVIEKQIVCESYDDLEKLSYADVKGLIS